ncbi:MAG: 1-(5-phosphoribosyl)-5-amino-4-imidazole-carboxylate carboxylase, partial [Desulfovibrio sp.]
GFAALCGMLTSCAGGVSVVNNDNGFGAACAACKINNMVAGVEERKEPGEGTPF